MSNEGIQRQRSITLTSGTINDLAPDCEQLKIRGAVTFLQDVRLKTISTHGHSSFHSCVMAHVLKNTGSCIIKDYCEISEVTTAGNLKIRNGQIATINSSGKLTIEQNLQAQQFHAIGFVKAQEIHAAHFHLKLSGASEIDRLIAEDITIEKDKLSISIVRKKLQCKSITGKHLHLSYTNAEVVEGDVVIVGSHCTIQTLYYTKSYTISPNAKVQQIIQRVQL
ncbi:hypothetical protein ACIP9G_17320 [Lysinibacillus sp. NPDC093197]|uniref:hypothetical protein n=1 Tax=Lysinibacillus sp. NPDC093197 TaxID=3364132 RepID=UPI0037F1FB6D